MEKQTKQGAFDFIFDPSLDPMDDFFGQREEDGASDLFLPNDEGRTEFLPPDPDRIPVIDNAVKQDSPEYAERPAEERTRELFNQMRPHRATLLDIIEASRNPCSIANMTSMIEDAHTRKFSVYSPSNLCTMLEVAGALTRVTEDGRPYDRSDLKPSLVLIDGEEFYEPTYPPTVHWLATEAGLAMTEEDDPLQRVHRLFEREADLSALYKRVLILASEGEGASMAQFSAALDDHPLIAQPRRFYSQHFVEALERCNAVAWSKTTWKTTETGMRALELLADVEDDYEAPGKNDGALSTETDGINW